MQFLNILMLAIVTLQFSACSSTGNSNNSENKMSDTQTWEILISETQCAIYEPKQVLVKTQLEFDVLWEQTWKDIGFAPDKPKVDFSKKWVIAAYLGTINTGGNKIQIESVLPDTDQTSINLKHLKLGPGCLTTQAIEFPFMMASIDHFKPENVKFDIKTILQKCD